MSEENKIQTTLVKHSSNGLMRVSNSIAITQKILFENVEYRFNQAFNLLNSKNISQFQRTINHFSSYKADINYTIRNKYDFYANNYEDYLRADNIFCDLVSENPSNILFLEMVVMTKSRLGYYYSATKTLDILNKVTRKNNFYLYNFTDPKYLLELHQHAIKDFSQALNTCPVSPLEYVMRGIARFDLKDYTRGQEDIAKAVQHSKCHEDRSACYLIFTHKFWYYINRLFHIERVENAFKEREYYMILLVECCLSLRPSLRTFDEE